MTLFRLISSLLPQERGRDIPKNACAGGWVIIRFLSFLHNLACWKVILALSCYEHFRQILKPKKDENVQTQRRELFNLLEPDCLSLNIIVVVGGQIFFVSMKRKFMCLVWVDCETYPQTPWFHLIPLSWIILFIRQNPFSDCYPYYKGSVGRKIGFSLD